MPTKLKSSLVLNDLKLNLYLGVTAKERQKKQPVLITIKIDFAKLPRGCKTNKIDDVVCYDDLARKIKQFCKGKKFILIENLCFELFHLVEKNIPRDGMLCLSVTKLKPMKDLKQSVFGVRHRGFL
jgi:FolB domain-containing protein